MLLLISLVALPITVLAHEGNMHKTKATEGEVTSIAGDLLTVRGSTGTVTPVTLTAQTKVERGDAAAGRSDLKPGEHVSVFGTKLPTGELVAQEIDLENNADASPHPRHTDD